MLSSISALAYAPTMAPVSTVTRAVAPQMMDLAGLKDQAKQLNPVVGGTNPPLCCAFSLLRCWREAASAPANAARQPWIAGRARSGIATSSLRS